MKLQNSRALLMKGLLDSINYECCKEKIMCRRIPDPILRTKRLTAFRVLNLAASTSSQRSPTLPCFSNILTQWNSKHPSQVRNRLISKSDWTIAFWPTKYEPKFSRKQGFHRKNRIIKSFILDYFRQKVTNFFSINSSKLKLFQKNQL